MKGAFRKSINWLHTWTGLALGWMLFFVFLTGTAGYFDTEIDRWMQPELPGSAEIIPEDRLIAMGLQHLQQQADGSKQWRITLPTNRDESLAIAWKKESTGQPMRHGQSMQNEIINHKTNQIAEPRATAGGQGLYRMHYRLHYMPAIVAFWLIGLASMFMLLAIVTGIVIHIKIFKDFFTFRPKEGARSWLDAHSVVSVLALPFHLMITYSGLAFFIFTFMSMVFIANYDQSELKNIRSEAFPSIAPFKASGEPSDMTNIQALINKAKTEFGPESQIHRITIDHPYDTQSIVTIQRHDTGLMHHHQEDKLYFDGVTGEKLKISHPDRPVASNTRSVLLGLHEGHFADSFMRWLYFLSGLLGTAMIATGLLLWVEKRRFKYENKQTPTKGYLLVQRNAFYFDEKALSTNNKPTLKKTTNTTYQTYWLATTSDLLGFVFLSVRLWDWLCHFFCDHFFCWFFANSTDHLCTENAVATELDSAHDQWPSVYAYLAACQI